MSRRRVIPAVLSLFGLALVGVACGSGDSGGGSGDASLWTDGGAGGCPGVQCVRAISCVAVCGGPVVATGCCCPSGTVAEESCPVADAGPVVLDAARKKDASPVRDASTDRGSKPDVQAPIDADLVHPDSALDATPLPPIDASVIVPDAAQGCGENAAVPSDFLSQLTGGVWLLGWSGGLDHFSFVRFDVADGASAGSARLKTPVGVTYTGYFPCEGSAVATVDTARGSVALTLPADCGGDTRTFIYRCVQPTNRAPATLEAVVHATEAGHSLSAWRYARTHCSEDMASCAAP